MKNFINKDLIIGSCCILTSYLILLYNDIKISKILYNK